MLHCGSTSAVTLASSLHRKKKKKSKAEEVVEVVEKVEEKAEEVKNTRTSAEKAYAAVQAKRVSFPASNTGCLAVTLSSHSKSRRYWRRPKRPTNRGWR